MTIKTLFDSRIVGFKPDSLYHIWLRFASSDMNKESCLNPTPSHQISYMTRSVCVSVCLSLTAECPNIQTWILAFRPSGRISRSSSRDNVIGHSQGRIQDFSWGVAELNKRGQFGPCSPHMAPNSVLQLGTLVFWAPFLSLWAQSWAKMSTFHD